MTTLLHAVLVPLLLTAAGCLDGEAGTDPGIPLVPDDREPGAPSPTDNPTRRLGDDLGEVSAEPDPLNPRPPSIVYSRAA